MSNEPEKVIWAFDPALGRNRWFKKGEQIPQILEPGQEAKKTEHKRVFNPATGNMQTV